MKNSFINKYEQKKQFLESLFGRKRNKDDSEQDNTKNELDKLTMIILSTHKPISNQQRKILKEKRLNTIFNKDIYYNTFHNENSKNNGKLTKNNISFFINDNSNNNFLDRYKDLYGLTTKNKNINYNNKTIINYLNILKFENEDFFGNNSKINYLNFNYNKRNMSQAKENIKKNYINLTNELLGGLNIQDNSNNSYFNSFNNTLNNIKENMRKNKTFYCTSDNRLNINKNLSQNNSIEDLISSQINSNTKVKNLYKKNNKDHKRINLNKKNIFLEEKKNNRPDLMYKLDQLNNLNYFDYNKNNNKFKSSSRINKKRYNNSILYKNNSFNTVKNHNKTDNNRLSYNKLKERFNYKLNNFKAKLELLSIK